MTGQEPLLDDIDAAVEVFRRRHADALSQQHHAALRVAAARDGLYAALRVRQATRTAGQVDAPVPCRDCLVELAIVPGAGAYTAGYVHHEIIMEAGELPYATCGARG